MSVTKFPRLLIGSVAQDGALTVSGTTSSLTLGQLGFALTNGTLVNAAGTLSSGVAQALIVAQGTGKQVGSLKSYPMLPNKVKKAWAKTYSATTAQVSYIGFDGSDTTKTLTYACDTTYQPGIQLSSSYINKYYGDAGIRRFFTITTPCCADCPGGCDNLDTAIYTSLIVEQVNKDNLVSGFVSAVLVTNGTFTANNGTGFTLAVTQGSTGVISSGAHGLTVGQFIRIGGTGNTVAVYQVAAVPSTTTLVLNTPFQGVSGTIAAANWGVITAYTVAGIQFTGEFLNRDNGCSCQPVYPYDVDGVVFTLFPSDGTDTGTGWDCLDPLTFPTYTTAIAFGNGSGMEVVYLENEIEGYSNLPEFFYDPRFQKAQVNYSSAAVNYDLFYIAFDNAYDSTVIDGEYSDHHITIIAVPTGSTVGTTIKTLLNTWIVAPPISLPVIP